MTDLGVFGRKMEWAHRKTSKWTKWSNHWLRENRKLVQDSLSVNNIHYINTIDLPKLYNMSKFLKWEMDKDGWV